MKKLTLNEASQEIGISKEAIHNRIRRGTLNCVIENGVKFVMLDENNKQTPKRTPTVKKVVNNNVDDKYYKLLEEQNKQLQDKLEKLELETRVLRDQKEQMLIAEKIKIEEIYIRKDDQLKSILNAINTTAMINAPQKEVHDIEIVEVQDDTKDEVPISLNKYLKSKNISKKKKEKIKIKFKKKAKKDTRIITMGDKYYVKPLTHNYHDLTGNI